MKKKTIGLRNRLWADVVKAWGGTVRQEESQNMLIEDLALAGQNLAGSTETLEPPEGFDFGSDVIIYKNGDSYSINKTPSDFIDFDNDFDIVMYADHRRPDNNGDGLSWATAKRSIGACVDTARDDETNIKIMAFAGVYHRQIGPGNGSSLDKAMSSNISIQAVNGRVVTGPFETLTWTKTGGQNFVYQASRSSAQRIFNPTYIVDGQIQEYKFVGSIAECDAEAGTWYTDDSICYVHANNDAPISDTNARVFLSSKNFGVVGVTEGVKVHLSGIDFQGGSTGAFKYEDVEVVVSQDCTFDYALSGKAVASKIAIDGVVGLGGLFVGYNSGSSYNSKDGFNFHESSTEVGNAIMSNCFGFVNGGIVPATSSSNGLTNHDGGQTIDAGGVYTGSFGSNVAIVSVDSKMWCVGTVAGNSGGDQVGISTGGFSTGTDFSCKAYLEHTEDKGNLIGINSGAGEIFIREHQGVGARVGNISELVR